MTKLHQPVLRRFARLAVLLCAVAGSEPFAQDDVFQDGFENDGMAHVTGTVWAPANAPGDVPEDEEIPVHRAIVQLTDSAPDPIPQQVHCVNCADVPESAVRSDHLGNFYLSVEPGTYWLSIRKGFFEIRRQVTVFEGVNHLQQGQTTLPSKTDAPAGDWAPKIALAVASYDPFETVLAKMGLGSVDEAGAFILGSEVDYYDMYLNRFSFGDITQTLTSLVSNLANMNQYHVIIIPASGSDHVAALQSQQTLKNIRDWVSAGGWLVVSEWSGEWHDNVIPSRMELEDGDTPSSAYDANSDTWNTTQFGDADGVSYSSQPSGIAEPGLRAWLDLQSGPTTLSSSTTNFDPSSVKIPDIWGKVINTTEADLGQDAQGATITDIPQIWANSNYSGALLFPTTTSYRAGSCGTVWFSTGKMAWTTAHLGLIAHERVSVYGLMEAGRCEVPAL